MRKSTTYRNIFTETKLRRWTKPERERERYRESEWERAYKKIIKNLQLLHISRVEKQNYESIGNAWHIFTRHHTAPYFIDLCCDVTSPDDGSSGDWNQNSVWRRTSLLNRYCLFKIPWWATRGYRNSFRDGIPMSFHWRLCEMKETLMTNAKHFIAMQSQSCASPQTIDRNRENRIRFISEYFKQFSVSDNMPKKIETSTI